jgi:hypothetical protein
VTCVVMHCCLVVEVSRCLELDVSQPGPNARESRFPSYRYDFFQAFPPAQKFQQHSQLEANQRNTMAQRTTVRTTYEVERTLQPIYSGGSIALSEDGRILAACLGEEALLTDLSTGKELARAEGDGEAITSLACKWQNGYWKCSG